MTANPNRAKRRCNYGGWRAPRTRDGGASGVTVYRADPAAVRRALQRTGSVATITAAAERTQRKRWQDPTAPAPHGAVVVARGQAGRTLSRRKRQAAPGTAKRPITVARLLAAAERAERLGHDAVASALLDSAVALEATAA